MLQSFIHRLLVRRHFWRYATFDEISELYASRMMRIMAQSLISLFVALYLFQNGFSVLLIALVFAALFAFRTLLAYPAARLVAYYGPKHGILFGNLLYIPALIFFTQLPQMGLPALILFGIFQALSTSIYDISYLVDFSKVKHIEHAGKEIGYMQIFDRLATSLSPVIGGLVAFLIAPEATMWLSALLFATASIPLFRTREPVRVNQRLHFRGFPWADAWRSLRGYTAVGLDFFTSNSVWVLFLAVTVFATSGNDIYLKIGALASVTVFTSFLAAYAFGKVIDWRHGGDLLRIATIANALVHVFRSFVTTPAGAAATNVANEIATTGYNMAYMRGIFDTADRSRYRIVYLMFITAAYNFGVMIACLILVVLIIAMPDLNVAMQVFFVVAATYTLIILRAGFRLYR